MQERLANASGSPQAEALAGVQLLLIEDPLPLTLAQLEGTAACQTVLARAGRAFCLGWACVFTGVECCVGPSRPCTGIARCDCDPVRRSGRREAAGLSGARPEGDRDAAIGWGSGSGCGISLGVLVHRPWLRPFLLQYATTALGTASPHTLYTSLCCPTPHGHRPACRTSRHSVTALGPLALQQFSPTTES